MNETSRPVIAAEGLSRSYRLGAAVVPAVCDVTLSMEGDPCGLPNYAVCSVDGKDELICQGGTFVKSRACRKTGCQVTNRPGRLIDCD